MISSELDNKILSEMLLKEILSTNSKLIDYNKKILETNERLLNIHLGIKKKESNAAAFIDDENLTTEDQLIAKYHKADERSFFTERAIALVMGFTRAKLQNDRWKGAGIPFVKLGHAVRYRKKDVEHWRDSFQTFSSTSESDYKKSEKKAREIIEGIKNDNK